MLPVLDETALQEQGAAALARMRARALYGKPPEVAELFDSIWQILTCLSWAAADRVVRSSVSYRELARDASLHLVHHLRSRASGVRHAERWLIRHEDMLWSYAALLAEEVDHALDFPLGVLIESGLDRHGRLIQHQRALRDDVPDELRPVKGKKRPRALVPDERVTERALDAIAATLRPADMRADAEAGLSSPPSAAAGRGA